MSSIRNIIKKTATHNIFHNTQITSTNIPTDFCRAKQHFWERHRRWDKNRACESNAAGRYPSRVSVTDHQIHSQTAPLTINLFLWTKWPRFRRRYFQMHFREWKVLYFDSNFTEVCSYGSNWQHVSIGSGNGMSPNDDLAHWRIYAALVRGVGGEIL